MLGIDLQLIAIITFTVTSMYATLRSELHVLSLKALTWSLASLFNDQFGVSKGTTTCLVALDLSIDFIVDKCFPIVLTLLKQILQKYINKFLASPIGAQFTDSLNLIQPIFAIIVALFNQLSRFGSQRNW